MQLNLSTGAATLSRSKKEMLNILFCGDVCPRFASEPLILSGKSAEMLADAAGELSNKDLSVVNLETPLTRAESAIAKSGPNLKVAPECIELIKAGKWDVACCANNHIGDYGPGAALETMEILDRNGIARVGVGKDLDEARKPLLVEKNGVKVAFIAVAENEFGSADVCKAGANPLQPVRNIAQIKAAKKLADLVIVLIHGGNEFMPVPSPRMADTYRAFADAGASAVVAGHTHCPQGMEVWHGVPIVYSLSDFLFDSNDSYSGYNWWYGYMVRIGFAGKKAVRLEVIPHHCQPHAEKVTLLKDNERRKFLKYLNHLNSLFSGQEDEAELRRYFDAWCLRSIKGYFARLGSPFLPTDWNSPESVARLMAMRNLHTCEAHNELLTATLRILEERREESTAAYLARLEALCAGKIPQEKTEG